MSIQHHNPGLSTEDFAPGPAPAADAGQPGTAWPDSLVYQPELMPPAPPEVLFDSTADSQDLSDSIDTPDVLGDSFSTGADSVTLSAVTLFLNDITPSDGDDVQVTLWSDASGAPGTEIASLGDILDSSLSPNVSGVNVTISGTVDLDPNTRYWIELNSDTGNGNANWIGSFSDAGNGVSTELNDVYGIIESNASGGEFMMEVQATQTCYAAGTHILTEHGEVTVEALRPGDRLVALHAGGAVPLRWIGRRWVDLRRHTRPDSINPVRIRAHAFGPEKPHRDLILSPDHAVLVGGKLLTVRHLINGASIVQETPAEICYYHLELDRHDIIFAEGLEAETFLDVGNRGFFPSTAKEGEFFRRNDEVPQTACAELIGDPAERATIHQDLLQRAFALGYRTTVDPCLHVLAGGRTIMPRSDTDGVLFDLPAGTDRVVLRSRNAIPKHMRGPDADARLLGVGVTHLWLDDAAVALDHAGLTDGWHAPEPGLRWTAGAATIRTAGARTMQMRLHPGLSYWDDVTDTALSAAA